ncbi:MAG: 2-C-methyl-D-erythritol 2,4-cyclodiphosphate synthase [Christensenellales bacterium]
MDVEIRTGYGYDAHRLKEGRKLVLLGVSIPHSKGLDGHSDADVAAHALIDALLGAAAMGDIGSMFPDSDMAYKDADSMELLKKAVASVYNKGFEPVNADITIVAQAPKLANYFSYMREAAAAALGVSIDAINVKATTTEGMSFEGEGLGMSAHAAVLITRGRE